MKLKVIIVLLLFSLTASAQSYRTVNKVVNLKQEHSFYINSKTGLNGKTRNSIKIDLPENTVQWFYVFTTTVNETEDNHTDKNIELGAQLASLLLNSNTAGLATKVVYQIVKPRGTGVVDVYLTDYNGYSLFNQKDALGLYTYVAKPASYYAEGSRENAKDATVVIDDVNKGSVYLCFRNPKLTQGILVTLEVSAIVATQEYVDVWTNESKQSLTNDCLNTFYNKNSAAQETCGCVINRIVSDYNPGSFYAFTQGQKNQIFEEYLSGCYDKTGNSDLKDANERLEELYEEIRGLNMLKDYENLILKYEEAVSLGVDNDQIYNSLGWCYLLTQNFEKAKSYLTKGLGKNPNNLYLQGNLAHYFLLTGNYQSAEEIYVRYKKKKLAKKLKWKDAVKEDFKLFESRGMYIPEMDKIRKLLKIKK